MNYILPGDRPLLELDDDERSRWSQLSSWIEYAAVFARQHHVEEMRYAREQRSISRNQNRHC